jgi:toxin-antitoxin system protein
VDMDEKKLRLLNDFQKLSEGKSSEDMIPLVLAFMEKAKKENITFSKDEISVLFEEARKGMSS